MSVARTVLRGSSFVFSFHSEAYRLLEEAYYRRFDTRRVGFGFYNKKYSRLHHQPSLLLVTVLISANEFPMHLFESGLLSYLDCHIFK